MKDIKQTKREPLIEQAPDESEIEDSWWKRLSTLYPRSLIFVACAQYFNQGASYMTFYCMKDLYKRVYEVEPATLQTYNNIVAIPYAMKVLFGMIIDTKATSRRTYLVLFGLLATFSVGLIAI